MRIFLDERGSFSWRQPGWSIVAVVGMCELDGTFEAVLGRLRAFKRTLPKERRSASGEIKGAVLTDQELATFVWDVLPRDRGLAHVSLVGFDSRQTPRDALPVFAKHWRRAGLANTTDTRRARINEWSKSSTKRGGNRLAARNAVAIADALTHFAIALLANEHDDGRELAALSYVIDRSSRIRGERQEYLWRQILNSALCTRSEQDPFPQSRQWPDDHAFLAKYRRDEGLDFRELWRKISSVTRSRRQDCGLRILSRRSRFDTSRTTRLLPPGNACGPSSWVRVGGSCTPWLPPSVLPNKEAFDLCSLSGLFRSTL